MELSLKDIINILLSKIWTIILSVILGGVVGFVLSNYILEPVYQSRVSVYVFNADVQNKASNTNDLLMAQRLVNSYIALLQSDNFLNDVIEDANLNVTAKELKKDLKMSAITDTELFEIIVSSRSPSLALKIANSIEQLAPIKLKEMVQTGATKIIDTPFMAEKPSSPNVMLNTVIGIILGLVISCMAVLAYDMFDVRIKTQEEITQRYNIPVIGSIPLCQEDKKRWKK